MKRHLTGILAGLAILAACALCDTLDARPEPTRVTWSKIKAMAASVAAQVDTTAADTTGVR